ncbi:MAG: NAD(P)/FAD-dependent oxidoreductase, partial [Deltaproteobacteria bacterium]|nr:NAD(P)/FAD-dependent oxidoreductase [Deltaproteobacteria bacterium]
ENTYPGCRVDVGNHFYCYSFEPNHEWSEYFSQRDELHDYFERCGTRYGVRDQIRFETEVVSARFDEAESIWDVLVRTNDGAEEVLRVNAIISAVGQLNRPKIPQIEGLESFTGAAFHSAEWDSEVQLEGKRIAVVGTGASAFQMVPELARTAQQLFVFPRSPGWMLPNKNYHRRVPEEVKWLMKHVPYYARWYRFLIFWPGSDGLWPSLKVDPDWPHPERSVNAANEAMRVAFVRYMEAQLGGDAELLAKVTPSYPPFGKRILQDNGSWLEALMRDNVELVSDSVAKLTHDAVVSADGAEYPVDVVIFATGFHANKFLWPMEIRGRGGIKLSEKWGDDPEAYLGMTVPSFPNLFCLYGPGTNLAHAGSIIFHSECQVRYIMGCIKALIESDLAALECKQEVHDEYNQRLNDLVAQMVWSHPGMDSWYKNSKGRVTILSPWLLVDYWRWTRELNLEDYDLYPRDSPSRVENRRMKGSA